MGLSRVIVFLGLLLAVSAALHWFFWFRLVRSTALPVVWTRALSLLFLALAALLPCSMVWQRLAGQGTIRPLLWIAFTWMGLVLFLLCLLLAGEFVRLAFRLWWLVARGAGAEASAAVTQAADWLRLSRGIALFAGLGAMVVGGVAMFSALRPPAVKEVRVVLKRWPRTLSGYTIAQISDLHVGPTLGSHFVDDLVRRISALRPDLIAITGDLIDGEVTSVGPSLRRLSDLQAPDGVYFITGNHEYYSGVESWVAFVRSLGLRVLRNERVAIRDSIDLVGVEDWHAHGPLPVQRSDLPGAFNGRDPERPVILLAHQPGVVTEAAGYGVDLQISGHTHGGQIWPFHRLTRLFQPFLAGLHRVGDTMIYVSRGTGYWGPPMRLFAPAEITLIRISAPD